METASMVLRGVLHRMKGDGFDLNAMHGHDIVNLLLDGLEKHGFLVIKAPVKREDLPASLPTFIGKNHIAVLACMMNSHKQYTDIGNIRVRWRIPVDEEGDIEYLERLGYAERSPYGRDCARITDQGRKVVEQARAHGYKPEPEWTWAAR